MRAWRHNAVVVVIAAAAIGAAAGSAALATHGHDADCGDFRSQAAAQDHMRAHPGDPDRLDGNDGDGRACESNPCPCDYETATGSEPQPVPDPTAPSDDDRDPDAGPVTARIVEVVDGDTLGVRLSSGGRRTVRVIGIDTPELRKPGVPVECGSRRATAHMSRLAFRRRDGRRIGRRVRLVADPTQEANDRYGRRLAYVDTTAGRDLGKAMARAGWGMVYVHGSQPFERFDAYDRAQQAARSADVGVWRVCDGDFHSEQ